MMNSAVVIEFRTKTLSYTRDCDKRRRFRLSRADCAASSGGFPRMMKQILLCVTAMVAKISLCERLEPGGVQSSRPRKILFAQNPLDPDVDRERAQPLVGKEHHTISNLRAYAGQLA